MVFKLVSQAITINIEISILPDTSHLLCFNEAKLSKLSYENNQMKRKRKMVLQENTVKKIKCWKKKQKYKLKKNVYREKKKRMKMKKSAKWVSKNKKGTAVKKKKNECMRK